MGKCAELKSDPRRPKLAQAGRVGVVTNWTAFYRDLDLPGCEQLVHMPLLSSKQLTWSYFVIFRPAKDQIAVWCAVRDTRVMRGLGRLPMFSGSVCDSGLFFPRLPAPSSLPFLSSLRFLCPFLFPSLCLLLFS